MSFAIEHELEVLLRGEIAAAETYKQVLEDLDGPPADWLRELQLDHGEAIRFLYAELSGRGFEPPTSSGVWGFFARAVEGTAKMVSDKTAFAALREGERRGLEQYEQALASGQLPIDCRTRVEQELIPAQRRHIEVLDRLIERA